MVFGFGKKKDVRPRGPGIRNAFDRPRVFNGNIPFEKFIPGHGGDFPAAVINDPRNRNDHGVQAQRRIAGMESMIPIHGQGQGQGRSQSQGQSPGQNRPDNFNTLLPGGGQPLRTVADEQQAVQGNLILEMFGLVRVDERNLATALALQRHKAYPLDEGSLVVGGFLMDFLLQDLGSLGHFVLAQRQKVVDW